MTQRILEPGEIQRQSVNGIPVLRLPRRESLFTDRAARLNQLAVDHPLGDYLRFIGKVADAQNAALRELPAIMLPKPDLLAQARAHGMPPLNAQTHQRDRAWCDVLRRMLRRLEAETEDVARGVIKRLEGERDELYEAQASKLLAGISVGLDLAYAPLIAAGLQVYWVHLVTTLGMDAFGPIDVPSVCPACGLRPVASIARSGGQEGGHRYLHCALCATEWHMVRIKCSSCESTKGINYYGIDGGLQAVKAETCDECTTYLKIFYMEHDSRVEPTADDLASTALDLLMADTGMLRSGPNLMLFAGEA